MYRKLYSIVHRFSEQLSKYNVSAHAAGTAFFLFLSLIPLLMLLCAIVPYTPITEATLMRFIVEVTPSSADALIVSLIKEVYARSAGVLSAAAIVTIWVSAKGMLALMRGLNAVNGVNEERNYFVLRFEACLYTVLMLAATILALLALVFGNQLIRLFEEQIPTLHYLIRFFLTFRFLFAWLILTAVFTILYTYVPKIRTRPLYQLPGAFLAAVTWSVFSWGFSVYVDRFNGLSMYGNLTTIIIVMLWLYFCMYLILVGAIVNRFFNPAIRFLIGKYAVRRGGGNARGAKRRGRVGGGEKKI